MFILHHYAESPYAEKIRAMLGYTGLEWQSVDVPPQPPRPSLDPVLGGYRRIPVMQDGADFYCDTRLIGAELAARSGYPELADEAMDDEGRAFIDHVQGDLFFAAIIAAPKGKMFVKTIMTRGLGLFKLLADRAAAAKGDSAIRIKPDEAKALWADHVADLETRLAGRDYIGGGAAPDARDFAAYHPVWINSVLASGKVGPHVKAWRGRIAAFGHGTGKPLSTQDALALAAATDPKPIDPAMTADGHAVGIAPADYMRAETRGRLVGESAREWIIARDTPAHGTVHVHFPKAGYTIA